MPGRRVRLGALAITATLAFAACGDGEGGGDPTGTSGTDTTGSEGGDADQTPDDDIALLAGGQQVGETTLKDGGELPDSMKESINANSQAVFPTEEIGIGSRWSQVLTSESEGFELDITTVYELKEVTDDEFVIAMSQDVPIDESVDGQDVSGEFTGTGEVRVSRANPLLLTADYTSGVSMAADGVDMQVGIDVKATST